MIVQWPNDLSGDDRLRFAQWVLQSAIAVIPRTEETALRNLVYELGAIRTRISAPKEASWQAS